MSGHFKNSINRPWGKAFSGETARAVFLCLTVFLMSRLLMALSFVIAARVVIPTGTTHRPGGLLDPLLRFDAHWYKSVIEGGYHFSATQVGQYNIAFFPGFPLAVKITSWVTGLPAYTAGVLFSNIAFLLALVVIYLYVKKRHPEVNPAIPVMLIAFFPVSYFFSSMYSESMYLLTAALVFWLLQGKKYLAASLLVGLAGATRVTGVTLLLPVLFLFNSSTGFKFSNSKVLLKNLLYGAAGTGGLLLFLLYQQVTFGFWNAFLITQKGWGRDTGFVENAASAAGKLVQVNSLKPQTVMHIIFILLVLFTFLLMLRHRDYYIYLLWLAPSILIPLSSGTTMSIMRFGMVLFPLFIYWGRLLTPRPLLFNLVLTLSVCLFTWLSALFSRGYPFV